MKKDNQLLKLIGGATFRIFGIVDGIYLDAARLPIHVEMRPTWGILATNSRHGS